MVREARMTGCKLVRQVALGLRLHAGGIDGDTFCREQLAPCRARRAQAAVQASPKALAAAQLAAAALCLDSRLPESLLLEWLQGVGGLLLAQRLKEGGAWLTALITLTPAVKATANPLPRRIALIALLALELIEPLGQRD